MKFKVSEEDKNKSGIYMITNLVNKKYYVGSAVNFNDRFYSHISTFKYNRNSKHLQNAYNKYGGENFEMEIIDIIENKDDLIIIETMYISLFDATNKIVGYNMCKIGNSNKGKICSKETKEKLRIINLGKKMSEETKRKMSKVWETRIITEEYKKRLADSRKNIIISEETRNKMNETRKRMNEDIRKMLSDICTICEEKIFFNNIKNLKYFNKHNCICKECNKKIYTRQGENGSKAKLNNEEVLEIKKLLNEGILLQKEIGKLYNVTLSTINSIKTGRSWQHIKLDDE